jgi:hypothetical protein
MVKANLYLDRVDLGRYWPENSPVPYSEAIVQLREGRTHISDYPFLTPRQGQGFSLVLEADKYLPPVAQVTTPRPVKAELLPVHGPDEDSIIIVSGNNEFTLNVLAAVWAQGSTPAYFLLVDCLGSTVDMAMIYAEFTPDRLRSALQTSNLEKIVKHRHLIVPGFTSPLASDFERVTGWEVEVGPICAVELPLFLEDRWTY